jgi:hypothetical protein
MRDVTIFIALAACLGAQTSRFAPDRMDTVLYGVAYYPEYKTHA